MSASRTAARTVSDLAVALERTASWVRRMTPPTEWNAAALSTLDALDRSGPMRVTDLALRERITQPGMTGLVTRLHAAGLVERAPDATDGRVTLVEISAAGRAFMRKLHAERAAALAVHLAELPPDARHQLVAATAALDALAGRPTTPA